MMTMSNANSTVKERRVYYYPRQDIEQKLEEDTTNMFSRWDRTMIEEDASMIARGTTGLKTW